MTKGLEALNEIKEMLDAPYTSGVIKQGLNIIEKELKALEIIKREFKPIIFEHDFGKYYLKLSKGNTMVVYEIKSQEEFDFLKEVLLCKII